MSAREVNIPLLRKAVEWAEAEAAKPPELCEWVQGRYFVAASVDDPLVIPGSEGTVRRERSELGKAQECGTCFCIAGYAAVSVSPRRLSYYEVDGVAKDALGLTPRQAAALFCASNTIEEVRRIAEDIAGERL